MESLFQYQESSFGYAILMVMIGLMLQKNYCAVLTTQTHTMAALSLALHRVTSSTAKACSIADSLRHLTDQLELKILQRFTLIPFHENSLSNGKQATRTLGRLPIITGVNLSKCLVAVRSLIVTIMMSLLL